MTNYSYKDITVKIGGSGIYCSDADISYSVNLVPSKNIENRLTDDFLPTTPPVGQTSFSYYLTGSDPLYDYVINTFKSIPIEIGGFTVQSGYLNGYSLDFSAHQAIQVNATFQFFEKLGGSAAAQSAVKQEIVPLVVSDLSLLGGQVVQSDKVANFSYNYSTTLQASYEVQEVIDYDGPSAVNVVTSDLKKVESNFSIFDHDMSLPITGKRETVQINLNDKNGNLKQSYYIDGVINNKSINIGSSSNRVISSYSIGQGKLGGPTPNITGVHPSSGVTGELMTISGENFVNVDGVFIGEYPISISGEYSATEIKAIISRDIISGYKGPVSVSTHGGRTTFTGNAMIAEADAYHHVTGGYTYYY